MQYNSFNQTGWLNSDLKKYKNLNIIFGDIRDTEQMINIIKDQEIVINLAALIGIPYSYKSARSYFETNVMGLMNILEASKKRNVKNNSCFNQ